MNFKIYKIHYIIFFFGVSCQTGFAQFVGGNAEGSASSDISNSICSSFSVNPFAGGIGSGVAFQEVSPFGCPVSSVNPFSGGTGRGSIYIQSTSIQCDVVTVNPFSGGTGSGSTYNQSISILCDVVTVNPFSGGTGNGDSFFENTTISCPVITVNPYSGGSGNGESSFNVSVSPCPVITVNPYSGGLGGGSYQQEFSISPCPVLTVNPYSGGIGEGSTFINIMPVICSAISVNPFSGGSNGGYALDCVIVNNPLTCWPLPINLLGFTSFCDDERLFLKWITLTEYNNDYFTIEKSTDLSNWQFVGQVKGAGNSSDILTYFFEIENPLGQNHYYRLSQFDFNGQFEVFEPIRVKNCLGKATDCLIYPNPTFESFQIIVENSSLEHLEIYNTLGEKVSYFSSEDNSTFTLNHSKGIYYLHIQTFNQSFVKVLVIE